MKRLLTTLVALFILPVVSMAYTSPGKPQGFVNDYAHVFSDTERASLEVKLSQFEQTSSNEITVVTVPTIGEDTIENYAVELFKEWGIGKKVHDNGILLLIAVNDHLMRIEVGYGLEGAVPDATASSIIRNTLTPAFRANDFYGGINKATDELIAATKGEYAPEESGTPLQGHLTSGTLVVALYLLLWIGSVLARSRSWWGGGVVGAVISIIIGFFFHTFIALGTALIFLVPFGLLFDFIVSRAYSRHLAQGSKHFPWWIGGGRGPGGFGGGSHFGGFGGGGSGGGGSSGSW